MGWGELGNGDLIVAAESAGFDVMVTGDKNLRYQQNIAGRKIMIVVLNALFIKWSYIAPLAPKVLAILDGGVQSGAFIVVDSKTL